jgi:hypothetical protein
MCASRSVQKFVQSIRAWHLSRQYYASWSWLKCDFSRSPIVPKSKRTTKMPLTSSAICGQPEAVLTTIGLNIWMSGQLLVFRSACSPRFFVRLSTVSVLPDVVGLTSCLRELKPGAREIKFTCTLSEISRCTW